jgi:hypothetical protein
VLAVGLSLISAPTFADSFVVSLLPNQTFTSLGDAESAMRAYSPQASHLVQFTAVNTGSQTVYYYNVPPVAATPAPKDVYGAPYYIYDGYFSVPPGNTINEVIASWWSRYQAYWSWAFPGCSYVTGSSNYGNIVGWVGLQGTCSGGDWIYGTLVTRAGSPSCPADYTLSANQCVINLTATITQNSTCPYTYKTVQDWEREVNDPRPDLTDALENGADAHSLLPEATQQAEQCFVNKFSAVLGRTPRVSAEFRSVAYQLHLQDVWKKWTALNGATPEVQTACAAIKAKLDGEMGRSSINEECRKELGWRDHCIVSPPAGANGNHTTGNAFDISRKDVDELLQTLERSGTSMDQFLNLRLPSCDLYWGGYFTNPEPDNVHFQLR